MQLKRLDIETIAKMAVLFYSEPGASGQPVVSVRESGSQLPIFLIHETVGQSLWFDLVARGIDEDIPIFGLLPIPAQDRQVHTIEAMATRLSKVIRRIQPIGPYRIFGLMFGGVLAYEIAVQLVGQDQAVEFVGIAETVCPTQQIASNLLGQSFFFDMRLREFCDRQVDSALSSRPLDELFLSLMTELTNKLPHEFLQPDADLDSLTSALQGLRFDGLSPFVARLAAHWRALLGYAMQSGDFPLRIFGASEDSASRSWLSFDKVNRPSSVHGASIRTIGSRDENDRKFSLEYFYSLGLAISGALSDIPKHPNGLSSRHYHPLLTIQKGKFGRASIYCIPGAGASIVSFVPLATALGDDWPVHGFQPRGLEGELPPHCTVEAAGLTYSNALCLAQPTGPLHLVGHSFGGWIAFEMALILSARGRQVLSLTIIDGGAPSSEGILEAEYTSTEALIELILVIENSADKKFFIDLHAFARDNRAGQMRMLHAAMVGAGLLSSRTNPDTLTGIIRTFAAALRTSYLPDQIYPGVLNLVLARDGGDDDTSARRWRNLAIDGWRRHASELVVTDCEGSHFSMLKQPHIGEFAKWWRGSLGGQALS